MSTTFSIIIAPTRISAGPVAKGGMLAIRGVRNRERKKPAATVRAVRPVRPPSLMPLALSM